MADRPGGKSYRKDREKKSQQGKKPGAKTADSAGSPPVKGAEIPVAGKGQGSPAGGGQGSPAGAGEGSSPGVQQGSPAAAGQGSPAGAVQGASVQISEKDGLEEATADQHEKHLEAERLEKEQQELEQRQKEKMEEEQQEREQLELYIKEAKARLEWKQSLRTANMEAATNRYGTYPLYLPFN